MTAIQITSSSSTQTPPPAPMAITVSIGSACTVGDAVVSESPAVDVGGSELVEGILVVGVVVPGKGVVGAVVISGPKGKQIYLNNSV